MSDKTLVGGTINRDCSPYPQCTIFTCIRAHSGTVNNRCCYFCEKKEKCRYPCLNDPEKCGKCVKPPVRKTEEEKRMEEHIEKWGY